jgi:hypothetical protein
MGLFKVIVSNEARTEYCGSAQASINVLLSNQMRLELNIGSARASTIITFKCHIIITFKPDEARAEYWLSSSLYYYYYFQMAQLEPLCV